MAAPEWFTLALYKVSDVPHEERLAACGLRGTNEERNCFEAGP
jgi:hypothetical protein